MLSSPKGIPCNIYSKATYHFYALARRINGRETRVKNIFFLLFYKLEDENHKKAYQLYISLGNAYIFSFF